MYPRKNVASLFHIYLPLDIRMEETTFLPFFGVAALFFFSFSVKRKHNSSGRDSFSFSIQPSPNITVHSLKFISHSTRFNDIIGIFNLKKASLLLFSPLYVQIQENTTTTVPLAIQRSTPQFHPSLFFDCKKISRFALVVLFEVSLDAHHFLAPLHTKI